jgi:hypothetical protein
MTAPVTRWYYFIIGHGPLQMVGTPFPTLREAENALASVSKNLRHQRPYRILEGRIAPDLDAEIDSGMTEPSGRTD